jgi:predicted ATPase
MRIAISGTHASGKSTLIEAFLATQPGYTFEPEPYTVLEELYGEVFARNPTVDDFERQLEYQMEVLARYSASDRVISERSPADFLAYMLALGDRSHVERWLVAAQHAFVRSCSATNWACSMPEDRRCWKREERSPSGWRS